MISDLFQIFGGHQGIYTAVGITSILFQFLYQVLLDLVKEIVNTIVGINGLLSHGHIPLHKRSGGLPNEGPDLPDHIRKSRRISGKLRQVHADKQLRHIRQMIADPLQIRHHLKAVSYTHLDVYKRQAHRSGRL